MMVMKIKRAISETDDLSPPAEVTMLIIEVSTIIAMITRSMRMKTLVLPNFPISKMYSLYYYYNVVCMTESDISTLRDSL
jgi:hypothetical protein